MFRSPPLRAVPAGERIGARVLEGKLPVYPGHGSALTMGSSGVRWADQLRTKSGISEAEILTDAVREKVRQLNGEQPANTDGEPLIYVAVVAVGIEELERGGFFGVSATGAASLRNTRNELVWHGTAASSSTHLRRREEYDMNPALYAEDFREAAEDIARQLVDGPIRSVF